VKSTEIIDASLSLLDVQAAHIELFPVKYEVGCSCSRCVATWLDLSKTKNLHTWHLQDSFFNKAVNSLDR